MFTGSYTTTNTYTVAHAKHVASKIIADMKRCQQNYSWPSDELIEKYEGELIAMLKGKYVSTYEFGYKRDDARVVSWKYTAQFGDLVGGSDDPPGKIIRRVDIEGASSFNFMIYSSAWDSLSEPEKERVRGTHRVRRTTGEEPTDGNGYWVEDKTYSSTGVSTTRKVFRPY